MRHDLAADFETLGDGRAVLRGAAAGLVRWFDDRFRQMALEEGACEYRFPATIGAQTLTRAGYFEAHPDGATRIANGSSDYLLPPAVCYHAYAALANSRVAAPARLTACSTCFREADRPALTRDRLWEFTMREVIFIGPGPWVREERERWTARVSRFASEIRLSGSTEAASDPFFTSAGRGRQLIQRLKGLKDELRMPAGQEGVAVASFNLHETFFGNRFGLMLEDGAPASSGCVAFGLERWALAFLCQRGARAAATLMGA